jgi:hypothetical protein
MKMHCLPSQLDNEDAKTIQLFILIENEMQKQREEQIARENAELRLKGMTS